MIDANHTLFYTIHYIVINMNSHDFLAFSHDSGLCLKGPIIVIRCVFYGKGNDDE